MSQALSMPEAFVEAVNFASPLHDIGKVGIPDTILLKPATLTEAETEIIKKHTSIGERVLSGSSYPFIQMAASIALNHHERWDGTGYPRGLKKMRHPSRAGSSCSATNTTHSGAAGLISHLYRTTRRQRSSLKAMEGPCPSISTRTFLMPSKVYPPVDKIFSNFKE